MTTTILQVLCAVLVAATWFGTATGSQCYAYYNHAAKYNLDPVASSYPWDEVKIAMHQNPQLSQVFAQSTIVPTSRPPDSHYYQPLSVICPSKRFMLKAFQVDGKQCYVIEPEIQQVRYVHCSDQNNRECQYCSYNKGGISKCEEDYEWQKVWAYCKPIIVHTQPLPVHPKPLPLPPVHHNPHPYPKPHPQPFYPPQSHHPQPFYPPQSHHPQPIPVYPSQSQPSKIFAKSSYPYVQGGYGRWRRDVVHPHTGGNVEQISLFLPYQCSCKTFRC